jgi:hypothetical protein
MRFSLLGRNPNLKRRRLKLLQKRRRNPRRELKG